MMKFTLTKILLRTLLCSHSNPHPHPPRHCLWMLVNSTRVCAISLHLLSPWSSACFHLCPNPPLHLKVRMTALALVLSLCICVCSYNFNSIHLFLEWGRQVQLIVEYLGSLCSVTLINYFVNTHIKLPIPPTPTAQHPTPFQTQLS